MPDSSANAMPQLAISDILAMLRRWWWMFIPPLAVAIGLAVFFFAQSQPVYQAEAEVIIRTEESANLFPLSDAEVLVRSPSAEEGFLASTDFEEAARAAAGSDAEVLIDVGDLNSRVEPSFISFQARAGDAEQAALVAQTWAETYVTTRHDRDASELRETIATFDSRLEEIDAERAEQLQSVVALDEALQRADDAAEISLLTTQRLVLLQSIEPSLAPLESQARLVREELAELQLVEDFLGTEELSARVNRTAEAPLSPISPSLSRNLLLAILAALFIGGISVLLAETLDDRVRNTNDVADRFGIQSLAAVPHRRRDDQSPVTPLGPMAEAFHRLASAIDFSAITTSQTQVLMVTSARASESKTTTVSRLGTTLARQGRKTLIIGADLRLPKLGMNFEHASGPGLGEVLGGLYPFSECVAEVPNHEGLSLLHAGTVATEASPVDLLRNEAFGELIEMLRPHYDHILIDCPPILPVVDALEITRVCDAILLSVYAGRTRLRQLENALGMLVQATNKPILGFVLTGTKAQSDSYSGGYYARSGLATGLVDIRRELAAASPEVSPPPTEIAVAERVMPQPQVEAPVFGLTSKQSMSIDEVSFDFEVEEIGAAEVVAPPTRKETGKMRSLRSMLSVIVAIGAFLLVAAPAGAQTYAGDTLEEGILFIPADVSAGSSLNFAVAALEPNSELTFVLTASDGEVVDGLEVQGAVVVRTDAQGNFDGDIDLPGGLPDGVYTLTAEGTRANGSTYERVISFNIGSLNAVNPGASGDSAVTADSNAATAESPNELALTGSSSRSRIVNGLLFVGVGVALVAFAATRRSAAAEQV